MRLRALAPGKVNLMLCLGPTRGDGRHELVTVLESLSLADELVLESVDEDAPDAVVCPGVEGENLVARALAALAGAGMGRATGSDRCDQTDSDRRRDGRGVGGCGGGASDGGRDRPRSP